MQFNRARAGKLRAKPAPLIEPSANGFLDEVRNPLVDKPVETHNLRTRFGILRRQAVGQEQTDALMCGE